MPEPAPSMKGGSDEKEWQATSSDFDIEVELDDVIGKSSKTIKAARSQVQDHKNDVRNLDSQLNAIDRELETR